MSKWPTIPQAIAACLALAGCDGLVPYQQSPDTVIASNHDTGHDSGTLADGGAAIAYDPDGCQVWIMDDGLEGYSGRRYDPKSGLPICDKQYPPGTVLGNYQTQTAGVSDWVPAHSSK